MEHVEQATAAPGEKRDAPPPRYTVRCWKSIKDNTLNRCTLRLGHAGECEGYWPGDCEGGEDASE